VLCNLLVCLAVWLALAGHSVVDKILAILFPITAFVAAGFEHSIANMYFLTLGVLLSDTSWSGIAGNLVPVTLGNIVGGSGMVAAVYYLVYRQPTLADRRSGTERTRATDAPPEDTTGAATPH
jgi:formate/nitrite transporter FocA (FNT family)